MNKMTQKFTLILIICLVLFACSNNNDDIDISKLNFQATQDINSKSFVLTWQATEENQVYELHWRIDGKENVEIVSDVSSPYEFKPIYGDTIILRLLVIQDDKKAFASPYTLSFPPEKPINIEALVDSDNIQLSWPEVASATRYEIFRSDTSEKFDDAIFIGETEANTPSFIDLNVIPANQYYYFVLATNEAETSLPSEVVTVTSGGVRLTDKYDDSLKTYEIFWKAGEIADSFNLLWKFTEDEEFSVQINVSNPFAIEPKFGESIEFKLALIKGNNISYSETQHLTFAPPAPNVSNIKATPGFNTINWESAKSATLYEVYRADISDDFEHAIYIDATNEQNFTDLVNSPETTYHYFIVAVNDIGTSFPSKMRSITSAFYNPTYLTPLNTTGIKHYIDDNFDQQDNIYYPKLYDEEPALYMGQDQSIKNGWLFDFTKLDVSGNELPSDFTSESVWNCTRDNITGLFWEVKNKDPESPRYLFKKIAWFDPNVYTNAGDPGQNDVSKCINVSHNTMEHIQFANESAWCGHTDWRLPTIEELRSIVDYSKGKDEDVFLVDELYFPNLRYEHYWTSISNPIEPNRAFGFRLHLGDAKHYTKYCDSGNYYFNSALLVRGPDKSSLSFTER